MEIRLLRKYLYKMLGSIDRVLKLKYPKVVVLCYHSISNDPWLFSVSKETFINQLEFLIQKGFEFINIQDLSDYLNSKKNLGSHSILLTFDDGYKDILDIKDYLVGKGINPALFIMPENEKADRQTLGNEIQLLNLNELRELQHSGWVLGSHTISHSNLSNIDEKELNKEIKGSKSMLENQLNTVIDYFSYPKGRYNKKVLKVLQNSGYTLAFSMDDGYINQKTNKYLIPRVGIDKTHGTDEFAYVFSPSVIMVRRLIKKVLGNNLDNLLKI